ncbi:hypothetical protein AOLI_G00310490 [Acnodon oligacanthus]
MNSGSFRGKRRQHSRAGESNKSSKENLLKKLTSHIAAGSERPPRHHQLQDFCSDVTTIVLEFPKVVCSHTNYCISKEPAEILKFLVNTTESDARHLQALLKRRTKALD